MGRYKGICKSDSIFLNRRASVLGGKGNFSCVRAFALVYARARAFVCAGACVCACAYVCVFVFLCF